MNEQTNKISAKNTEANRQMLNIETSAYKDIDKCENRKQRKPTYTRQTIELYNLSVETRGSQELEPLTWIIFCLSRAITLIRSFLTI